MALAIFDLDHTLLNGDSDYLWGEFMVANGIVDKTEYHRMNRVFLEEYQRGELDNDRYLKFTLQPLSLHPMDKLHAWRNHYVNHWIKPRIATGTPALLDKHRQQGDELIIVSATNLFITAPIAELLEIPDILSTEPEIIDDRYTGNYLGTPTYKEGKVTVLNEWLHSKNHSLEESYFYSDSINDLPLLEEVGNPVAVNPDVDLTRIATQRQWPILDLRS